MSGENIIQFFNMEVEEGKVYYEESTEDKYISYNHRFDNKLSDWEDHDREPYCYVELRYPEDLGWYYDLFVDENGPGLKREATSEEIDILIAAMDKAGIEHNLKNHYNIF